jgi:hypothetical protein
MEEDKKVYENIINKSLNHRLTLNIAVLVFNSLLMGLTCYMTVKYSLWWLLLLCFWNHVKTEKGSD